MKAFFTGKVVGEVEKLHLKDEKISTLQTYPSC
jgi:hypothetical protein